MLRGQQMAKKLRGQQMAKSSGANKWQKQKKARKMAQGLASPQPMLKRLLPVMILEQQFIRGIGGQMGRYDLQLYAWEF